ncbi:MAG: hypothetical protein Q8L29_03855 [archaeon]|nr:hypothetical protein [archaeon]
MDEQIESMNPGIYELKKDAIVARGRLASVINFEESGGLRGVELKLIDYNGKELGSPRFYGDIDSKHRTDVDNGLSSEMWMKTTAERQKDGSLRQTQRLKIWLTNFQSIEVDYTSYMVERKNGKRSLISR